MIFHPLKCKNPRPKAWVLVDCIETRLAFDSSTETLVEAFYAAASSRLFLLTSIERVAVGAYVQRQVVICSCVNFEGSTARAVGSDGVVLRMDTGFHEHIPHRDMPPRDHQRCRAPHALMIRMGIFSHRTYNNQPTYCSTTRVRSAAL